MRLDDAIQALEASATAAFGNITTAVQQLVETARMSDLTGLRNSLALGEDFSAAQTSPKPHCLLFGDLNGFKSINDVYEHAAGDAALRRVGELLQFVTKPWGAAAYHKSGDEFVIIVAQDDKGSLLKSLEQYFQRVDFTFEGKALEVSGSFGCTEIGESDLLDAQGRAEAACRIAKSRGRGYVIHEWSPEDELEEEERRIRCGECGTSARVMLTGESRSVPQLHCPLCRSPVVVSELSASDASVAPDE